MKTSIWILKLGILAFLLVPTAFVMPLVESPLEDPTRESIESFYDALAVVNWNDREVEASEQTKECAASLLESLSFENPEYDRASSSAYFNVMGMMNNLISYIVREYPKGDFSALEEAEMAFLPHWKLDKLLNSLNAANSVDDFKVKFCTKLNQEVVTLDEASNRILEGIYNEFHHSGILIYRRVDETIRYSPPMGISLRPIAITNSEIRWALALRTTDELDCTSRSATETKGYYVSLKVTLTGTYDSEDFDLSDIRFAVTSKPKVHFDYLTCCDE